MICMYTVYKFIRVRSVYKGSSVKRREFVVVISCVLGTYVSTPTIIIYDLLFFVLIVLLRLVLKYVVSSEEYTVIMSSRDLKQTVKKIRRGCRGKHQGVTSCEQAVDSVTDDTNAVQNNVLMELGAQLAVKLNVSTNFKPTLERAKPGWTAACETREQVASNLSGYEIDAAQANEVFLHANMSWISSSCRSAASNTTHDSTTQDESESSEEGEEMNETSTMTNLPETDILNTHRLISKRVAVCESDAENVLVKTRDVVSNCKSKLKLKIKLGKVKVANRLRSSPIQEKHSTLVTNQVGNVRKLLCNLIFITTEYISVNIFYQKYKYACMYVYFFFSIRLLLTANHPRKIEKIRWQQENLSRRTHRQNVIALRKKQ